MIRPFRRRPPSIESPWSRIFADGAPARLEAAAGRKILCATGVGGAGLIRTVDSLVAVALWLRGAEPTMLLCDGALPACEVCAYVQFRTPTQFVKHGPQRVLCGPCYSEGAAFYAPLPFDVRRYSEHLEPNDAAEATAHASELSLDDCFTFEERGLRLGEQARAGTLRFFGKAQLDDEPEELVLKAARRYAAGAIVASLVAERAIERLEPECVVAHHGVYVPQGVLGEVARRDGVDVVNWGPSYRNTTIIASHGDSYHRTLIAEPHELWDDRQLSEAEEDELLSYLDSRRRGRGDWTWVTPEAALRPEVQEHQRLLEELELDPGRPIIGLLTNVLWDAMLYYEGHAFDDMLEWLWMSLDYFIEHPDLQLIVRIHPHEVKSGNRQPVGAEIARRYPALPSGIKIVPYDHPYNTYALMGLCRAVLIYGTKTGVELTPYGTPVIVAGDAWIRGKGLTVDVSSKDEYRAALDSLPTIEPLDADTVARARRYAYHYFMRRMIPLHSLDPDAPSPELAIETADELLPGGDPGLDVVCDGILSGAPFVYDRSSAWVSDR